MFLTKLLVKVPFIGMVNIIAEEMIVPELIQKEASSDKINEFLIQWLTEPEYLEKIISKLNKVKIKLGQPGASKRNAEIILEIDKF